MPTFAREKGGNKLIRVGVKWGLIGGVGIHGVRRRIGFLVQEGRRILGFGEGRHGEMPILYI
jgi:hypothetical protein